MNTRKTNFVAENRISKELFLTRLQYPLEVKVEMAKNRIRNYLDTYGTEGVYISYSGGKDSDVLLHLCRSVWKNLPAVFIDTPMEFPQVREHVKTIDNVIRIRPKKHIKEIIKEHGFCFPSKETATLVHDARKGLPYALRKINGLDKNGNPSEYRQQFRKWKPLALSEHIVSNGCCIEMKEGPAKAFEQETGRKVIVGTRAEESGRRRNAYLKTGCISYGDRPCLKPLSFFTEQDILQYIKQNNIVVAPPYGELVEVDKQEFQQISLFDEKKDEKPKLKFTGEQRLGCMFCPVGCHLDYKDGKFQKFERLKKFNPKLHDYCMKELGLGEFLDFVEREFCNPK